MNNTKLLGKRKDYTIFDSALACVLFIILTFSFSLVYNSLPSSVRANKPLYYFASFLLEALFGVAAWIVATARNVDLIEANGLKKKVNGKIVGLCAVLAIASIYLFGSLTNVFIMFLELFGYTPVVSNIEINNFGVYLVYVITTCVAPALFEEMLFRGTIESGFKSFGKKFAVVISAFIFMIMHGNPDQTIHQFIVGLILGYLFIESGNLWLGVIVHFFNNFISITATFIMCLMSGGVSGEGELVEEVVSTSWGVFAVEFIFAVLLAICGYFIVRKLVKLILDEDGKINKLSETTQNVEFKVLDENGTILTDFTNASNGDSLNLENTQKSDEDRFSVNPKDYEISDDEFKIDMEKEGFENQNLEGDNDANIPLKGSESASKKNENEVTMSTMIMFILSGGYLIFQWVISLFSGFMG